MRAASSEAWRLIMQRLPLVAVGPVTMWVMILAARVISVSPSDEPTYQSAFAIAIPFSRPTQIIFPARHCLTLWAWYGSGVMSHPTRTCKAVLKRLRSLGVSLPGPDEFYRVINLRTGRHQKAAGAWSWMLLWYGPEGACPAMSPGIGGYLPASVCATQGSTLYDGGVRSHLRLGLSLEPSKVAERRFFAKMGTLPKEMAL